MSARRVTHAAQVPDAAAAGSASLRQHAACAAAIATGGSGASPAHVVDLLAFLQASSRAAPSVAHQHIGKPPQPDSVHRPLL
jgi:hypothetical protein